MREARVAQSWCMYCQTLLTNAAMSTQNTAPGSRVAPGKPGTQTKAGPSGDGHSVSKRCVFENVRHAGHEHIN